MDEFAMMWIKFKSRIYFFKGILIMVNLLGKQDLALANKIGDGMKYEAELIYFIGFFTPKIQA